MNLVPFNYSGREVRVITDEAGNPWWVAKDVCAILGYTNHNDAINQHCKGVANRYPLQTSGGLQDVRVINEPDLYRLIIKSTLPAAQEFEKWVFDEVLPTIRKTGGYGNLEPILRELGTQIDKLLKLHTGQAVQAVQAVQAAKEINKMRTSVDANGTKWYMAKDVCREAGIVNTAQAVSVVREPNKKHLTIATTSGNPTVLFLNRDGAVDLLTRSKKKEAIQVLREYFKWEPPTKLIEHVKDRTELLYDPNLAIVKANTGFLKYIYTMCVKMATILEMPKHREAKGVKIGLWKLMYITLLASSPEDNAKAFEAAVTLVYDSGAYNSMSYADRKWLKSRRKGNIVLLWVNKLMNKEVFINCQATPEKLLVQLLKSHFPAVFSAMRDESIFWEMDSPYVYLDTVKMAKWCANFSIAKPFDMKQKHRTITPKVVISDIYKDLSYSLNIIS